jgi:basic amino acid/polyamine antiporter, APA family
MFARKPITQLLAEVQEAGMKRVLGPWQLLLLGVGCVLGAGIYVLPGTAAANYAGPAVVLSFIVAGAACALTALCYAELASVAPASGSSYTYCYAALGEVFAWTLGWLLMLEYGLAGSLLAVGFSGYFASLLHDFGVVVPQVLASPAFQLAPHGGGLAATGAVNLVAVAITAVVAAVLVAGVSESARVNAALVVVKIAVLAGFVALGIGAVRPANWTPFVPPSQGGFVYGWPGVLRAASILFFAYLGFETVSTAASEARDPQKHVPAGILGALGACTLIYVIVAAILTGVVPYRELGVPDPIAVAVDRLGRPEFAVLIKVGALAGLSSVLLVNAFGQSRIAYAMARDGLLPRAFAVLHPRFRTPWLGILLVCAVSAALAAIFPLALLGDLVSLGTGSAFMIVCLSVMWLRTTQPQLRRPFKVPLGGARIGGVWIGPVPVAAMLMCLAMIGPVVVDIAGQALHGRPAPAAFLGGYALIGALIYLGFGRRRSRVRGADTATAAAELLDAPEAP